MPTAANSPGLSSWRSRWYASGRPLSSTSIVVSGADHGGRPAADELGGVGVLLVRHHRRPGREGVRDPDEPEPRVRPPRDLLREPAQVHHRERGRGEQLHDEVAVRDRVQRVGGDAVEAELPGRRLAIERIARARQRPGAQRRDVEPAAGVGEPAAVSLEHLDVGEEVVGEQHGLGRLDVGRPRQDGVALALGQADERPLHPHDGVVEAVDRAPGPQAQVRRHLVVAGPPGVELAADGADPGREQRLEVEVDVLERRVPGDRAGLDVEPQGGEAALERGDLLVGQQPRAAQAADVGDRPRDVVEGQLGVDVDRPGEVRHPRIRLVVEPAAPQPHAPSAARCGSSYVSGRARPRCGPGPSRGAAWRPARA